MPFRLMLPKSEDIFVKIIKHSNFEQATRSPLIIYNPRTRVAQKIMSPTEFVDVFPTLTDMAQIAPPANVDGTSLLPMMMGQQAKILCFL